MTTEQASKLKPGARVVMTSLGYERLVNRWNTRASCRITIGTFQSYSYPMLIRILRDNHKTSEAYHTDFWEPVRQ